MPTEPDDPILNLAQTALRQVRDQAEANQSPAEVTTPPEPRPIVAGNRAPVEDLPSPSDRPWVYYDKKLRRGPRLHDHFMEDMFASVQNGTFGVTDILRHNITDMFYILKVFDSDWRNQVSKAYLSGLGIGGALGLGIGLSNPEIASELRTYLKIVIPFSAQFFARVLYFEQTDQLEAKLGRLPYEKGEEGLALEARAQMERAHKRFGKAFTFMEGFFRSLSIGATVGAIGAEMAEHQMFNDLTHIFDKLHPEPSTTAVHPQPTTHATTSPPRVVLTPTSTSTSVPTHIPTQTAAPTHVPNTPIPVASPTVHQEQPTPIPQPSVVVPPPDVQPAAGSSQQDIHLFSSSGDFSSELVSEHIAPMVGEHLEVTSQVAQEALSQVAHDLGINENQIPVSVQHQVELAVQHQLEAYANHTVYQALYEHGDVNQAGVTSGSHVVGSDELSKIMHQVDSRYVDLIKMNHDNLVHDAKLELSHQLNLGHEVVTQALGSLHPGDYQEVTMPKGSTFSNLLYQHGHDLSEVGGQTSPDSLGAHILANYDSASKMWGDQSTSSHWSNSEQFHFPLSPQEVVGLVRRANDGDLEAFKKLWEALHWFSEMQKVKILSAVGVNNIMEVAKRLS